MKEITCLNFDMIWKLMEFENYKNIEYYYFEIYIYIYIYFLILKYTLKIRDNDLLIQTW